MSLEDLGATYEVVFTNGGLAAWGADGSTEAYRLAQYHMHAPSEHTIDG